MFKELTFALYAIKKNIQSSAELRTSFVINVIGMGLNNIAFIILWGFFVHSVGVIGGWTVADIVGLQGFAAFSYGIVLVLAAGIRKLPEYINSGAFDRFMLSPKNILLRVATSAFSAPAVGDMLFGIICLCIYGMLINIGIYQIIVIIALLICASIVFLSVSIAVFSINFFFTDASTVSGSLFDLFLTPALFHGGAFQGALRFVFTFIIPSLLIGTLPVEAVRNMDIGKIGLIFVLSIVWLYLSLKLFNKALRKYESSNFMTFGS